MQSPAAKNARVTPSQPGVQHAYIHSHYVVPRRVPQPAHSMLLSTVAISVFEATTWRLVQMPTLVAPTSS